MSIVSLDIRDGVTPAMLKLLKKTRDLTPAMREIDYRIMKPLKSKAWAASGLKSRSGELRDAVTTWHGKKSAGVSVRSSAGKDLIIPKAVLQSEGAKKHQHTKKRSYRVRAHDRAGRKVGQHTRRNAGAPWGDVKARPFIPTRLGPGETQSAIRILEGFIDV